MDKFVTLDFVLSFPGMIASVIVLTQVFKKLFDKLVQNQTKYIVFGFSVLLCIFAASYQGDFSNPETVITTIVIWLINSAVVWTSAMKAFETITKTNKTDGSLLIHSNEVGEEKWEFDVATDLVKVPTQKYLRLKVEPQPDRSQK